jgi:hypothetical protein
LKRECLRKRNEKEGKGGWKREDKRKGNDRNEEMEMEKGAHEERMRGSGKRIGK